MIQAKTIQLISRRRCNMPRALFLDGRHEMSHGHQWLDTGCMISVGRSASPIGHARAQSCPNPATLDARHTIASKNTSTGPRVFGFIGIVGTATSPRRVRLHLRRVHLPDKTGQGIVRWYKDLYSSRSGSCAGRPVECAHPMCFRSRSASLRRLFCN
jgi:hypothetical protein